MGKHSSWAEISTELVLEQGEGTFISSFTKSGDGLGYMGLNTNWIFPDNLALEEDLQLAGFERG